MFLFFVNWQTPVHQSKKHQSIHLALYEVKKEEIINLSFTVEYSRNSALDCCGTDVYDRNHQVCCKKSSANQFTKDKDRGDDTDCCMPAEVPYNRHTHNCTQAGVLEKPETRVATIRPCPYCRRKTQPSSYCRARNGKRHPSCPLQNDHTTERPHI